MKITLMTCSKAQLNRSRLCFCVGNAFLISDNNTRYKHIASHHLPMFLQPPEASCKIQ